MANEDTWLTKLGKKVKAEIANMKTKAKMAVEGKNYTDVVRAEKENAEHSAKENTVEAEAAVEAKRAKKKQKPESPQADLLERVYNPRWGGK
jgi:hypothetical protein